MNEIVKQPSMIVVRCLMSLDKYKEGVVYVVKRDVGEALVTAFPQCFEFENSEED